LGFSPHVGNDGNHRDIKSSNILIDKGIVKLADLGSSKRIGEEILSATDKGIQGTLSYMAPEVLKSEDDTGKSLLGKEVEEEV